MAAHKSVRSVVMESAMNCIPNASSPLRRKSILTSPLVDTRFTENDDEAERLARRGEIADSKSSTLPKNKNDKRRSLGLGFLVNMPASQMAERISQCIKLGTENKINPKNAFSLELIDFMTYMIKKKDDNMSNLQLASTSLDVSIKIYGYRVDGVHMDILKMAGGLDKQEKDSDKKNNEQEIDPLEDADNNRNKEKQVKKKRKNKQRIFSTVEALRANVDTEKPNILTMEVDLQTTDMLYQVMLPNHANSKFYHHPFNDVFLDTIKSTDVNNDIVCNIPQIPNITDLEICTPLCYFDFQSWNADNDELEENMTKTQNENKFQFDLDASLPQEDEHISTGMNYFDIGNGEEENVDKCAMVPTQIENIVDFRQVLSNTLPTKVSEYSFIQKNMNIHWAGPSHWKITNFRKTLSNSQVIETCRQVPLKKKKEIELCYDNEIIKSIDSKYLPSQTAKLHARTAKIEWSEEVLTLPLDVHYDITQANKLYHHRMIFKYPENKDDMNITSLSDGAENYNYANENDTSNYCPDLLTEQYQENNDNNAKDTCTHIENECRYGSQMAFTGDNLVAVPKLTNKLNIAYSVRAKKIDMRQLKQSIWQCLRSRKRKQAGIEELIQDKEDKINESKHFSKIYKELPQLLTKSNVEALSFPISFVSLLHLANEKTLKINSSLDMTDIIIEQD